MSSNGLMSAVLATGALTLAAALVEAQNAGSPPGPPPGFRSHTVHQGEVNPKPNPERFKKPKRENKQKDGELTRGKSVIAAAWFIDPSNRYKHTPFGTEVHPTGLTVSTHEQRILKFSLPKDSVFEDRVPRLVDLDGDGGEEIVVVRAYERKGAALVVLGVRGNEVQILAETPPIGIPHRWLNPIGFGDFDGDGHVDIAIVQTPHLSGELQIWSYKHGKLEQIASTGDVSNHVNGSKHLKLSAVADFNGDGRLDIAVPSQDRRRLRFFTFEKGDIEEIGEVALPSPAAEDFEVILVKGNPAVKVGLAGGRTVVIAPCRDVPGWEMTKGDC